MRTLLLSIALFISAVAAAQVPSVTIENFKGESFDTSVLLEEGTPMIISFWSTSCKPCIRELDAIYDAMPDWLDEADFRVVAVPCKGKVFRRGTRMGRRVYSSLRQEPGLHESHECICRSSCFRR